MAWLTLRRRYMILGPLAILLPAGLLTYLGYLSVQGIEPRYREQVNEVVERIRNGFRNRTTNRINYTILSSIHRNFITQIDELIAAPLDENNDPTFQIESPFPFASSLFISSTSGDIYFFEKMETSNDHESQWKYRPSGPTSFVNRLRSEIQTKQQQADINFNFPIYLPYPPDDVFSSDLGRELALLYIFNPTSSNNPFTHTWINAMGFTFDFDYLNSTFFQEILDQMKDAHEIYYPIGIQDRTTHLLVAVDTPSEGRSFPISEDYLPEQFSENNFPWYKIVYSSATGKDKIAIARNEKIVYSCLIAATIFIMIIGVIGAQRNIFKELELSDMRSDFVARVSHELRTPIGLIRLYSETLELGRMKSKEQWMDYLRAITKESERLSHLINNILDFSQIEVNKKYYKLTLYPIEEVIYETIESMQYHFERNGLKLLSEIENNLPEIYCEPSALHQALYNLLSNAMKYSGDGEIVKIEAYQRDANVHIHIIDQGIGIAREHQKKIFQKFYRVDNPLIRKTGGSGLGLSVVEHIIHNHKGLISVQSKIGQGSTFSITLPIP
jgi:signal transduction histidine kinase